MAVGFDFSPPQGYPGGGGSQPVKVATGTVTSSSAQGTFRTYGGIYMNAYLLTITPPAGITTLIAVRATVESAAADGTTIPEAEFASPLGYADGLTESILASNNTAHSTTLIFQYNFVAGGLLSLTTSSIVIPVITTDSYQYAVYYQ